MRKDKHAAIREYLQTKFPGCLIVPSWLNFRYIGQFSSFTILQTTLTAPQTSLPSFHLERYQSRCSNTLRTLC